MASPIEPRRLDGTQVSRLTFVKNAGKNSEVIEVTKQKIKGNPQLLLRVPPELQKPLADEATRTGESRQGVLWRIAAKYFKGRKA